MNTGDQLYSVIANSQSCGVDIINEMLKGCSSQPVSNKCTFSFYFQFRSVCKKCLDISKILFRTRQRYVPMGIYWKFRIPVNKVERDHFS